MSLTFDSQDGNGLQIDKKLGQLLKTNLPIFYRKKKIIVQCARNKKLKTSENNKDR